MQPRVGAGRGVASRRGSPVPAGRRVGGAQPDGLATPFPHRGIGQHGNTRRSRSDPCSTTPRRNPAPLAVRSESICGSKTLNAPSQPNVLTLSRPSPTPPPTTTTAPPSHYGQTRNQSPYPTAHAAARVPTMTLAGDATQAAVCPFRCGPVRDLSPTLSPGRGALSFGAASAAGVRHWPMDRVRRPSLTA